MPNLLILTDGGGDIGFGHLMRCLSIKNAWNNGAVRLLAQMEGNELAPEGVETVDWLSGIEALSQYASIDDILLVDSYRPNAGYFKQLKKLFPFVAVLDDYNRISYPVDLIICPGIYGQEADYNNQTALTVGGADYVILRPEILAASRPEVENEIETILVTFGGSQQDELLFQKVINVLEEVKFKVVVVTGNNKLAKNLSVTTSQVYGRLDANAMAEVMATSDVAVSAAGQTLNELVWLGIPTFSIKTGEDQNGNWNYYNHNNLTIGAEVANAENLKSALVEALNKETIDIRLSRSKELKKLLTNSGANNICSLMESLRR